MARFCCELNISCYQNQDGGRELYGTFSGNIMTQDQALDMLKTRFGLNNNNMEYSRATQLSGMMDALPDLIHNYENDGMPRKFTNKNLALGTAGAIQKLINSAIINE